MVMLDNRQWDAEQYWTKALLVNKLVAARYNYTFSFYKPAAGAAPHADATEDETDLQWCKVPLLANAVEHVLRGRTSKAQSHLGAGSRNAPACTWIFFLDSDAFVRDR